MRGKLVESRQYHVWTDALHLRQLAREGKNRWDQGTYTRSALMMAWAAFEACLEEVLEGRRLGGRFRDNLEKAVEGLGLQRLDWTEGVWKDVTEVCSLRNRILHRSGSDVDLFLSVAEVDRSLEALRRATRDMYGRRARPAPAWIEDDSDRGWSDRRGAGGWARLTVGEPGPDSLGRERLRVEYDDAEGTWVHRYEDADADPEQVLGEFLERVAVPIFAVRIFSGARLILERRVAMRGA